MIDIPLARLVGMPISQCGNHWALKYLGKPWRAGAYGPDAFDCWALLVDIYQKQLGISLPLHSNVDRNPLDMACMASHDIATEWHEVSEPVDWCGVGLSNVPGRVTHVGVYIGKANMVLHTQKVSGCIIEPLESVLRKFKQVTYYAHSSRV